MQSDDDDDAPITKHYLKELNEKLDKLMASSSTQSSLSEFSIKGMVATLVKEDDASISKATSAIDASTKVCMEVTKKVDKLISNVNIFLESLQGAATQNADKMNASVQTLTRSLHQEKKLFEVLRQNLSSDQVKHQAPVNERFNQLQEN